MTVAKMVPFKNDRGQKYPTQAAKTPKTPFKK